ncbi:MAG: winged helix-turn-helix domain-containing protein, partial [Solimonas sp.]
MARKPKISIQSRFWLNSDGQALAGRGRIELLERIGKTGSIRQAALAMKMSYRAAWDSVDVMNQRAGVELIARKTGGARGGGAELSTEGYRLVALYRELE